MPAGMAEKKLKTEHKTGKIIQSLACAVLVFGLAAGVFFNFLEEKKQEKSIDAIQESILALEKDIQRQSENNQRKYDSLNEGMRDKERKISQAFEDIKTVQAATTENKNLHAKVENFVDTLLKSNSSENIGKPKPFSYYSGADWQKKVTNFLTEHETLLNEGWSITGGINEFGPFISVRESGNFIVNGLFYQGINGYRFENSLANVVFVTAPGLAAMTQDTMTIRGDAQMDSVLLDGCLDWTKESEASGFSVWKAKDNEGEIRRVKMTATIPASVKESCENNYLEKEMKNRLAQNLRDDKMAKPSAFSKENRYNDLPAEKTFGGVGIKFRKTKDGLHITEILPNTPAEKGGLYSGDMIVKIDQRPVHDMSRQQVVEALRGPPGTSVTLHYMPSGTLSTVRDTALIRSVISLEE
ncbi:PDZ domain-containing protein [Micavibrio aeruginosavorus]|uniref:S41 family peptidase n=1 Tax=Micavibrio aeruginosavorus TaxID=349221 RepID=UPI003F4AE5C0